MFSLKSLLVIVAVVAIFTEAAFSLNLDHAQNTQLEELSNEAGADSSDELDWLRFMNQENRFKRRKFDKSDPRSLFAAVYSNYPYAKRFEPSYYYPVEAAALQAQPMVGGIKRGLKSPLDPRNLFRAVYGYKK
jgi:hypothetical protein